MLESIPLLFPHEHTDLFTAVRELHMYGVLLERNIGPTRPITLLTMAAFHALGNVAAAGVAPTEKSQNQYIERVRRQLAKCATSIITLRDKGVIERDSTLFGLRLVDRALEATDEFRLELEVIKSMTPPTDPREPLPAEARALAEEQRRTVGTTSPASSTTGAASSPNLATDSTALSKPQLVSVPGQANESIQGVPAATRPKGEQPDGKDRPNGRKT